MKRITAILLAVIFLFIGGACTKQAGKKTENKGKSETETSENSALPLLWHATDKSGREIYFFGTIHVGDNRNKKVLNRLKPILKKCDALAVEFDLVSYSKNLAQQAEDITAFLYKDGTTVRDHISAELYENLKNRLTDANLYNEYYDYYNLGLWFQLVDQAVIAESKLSTDNGMDGLLIKNAKSEKREILEVESSTFQNNLMASTPEDYYILSLEDEMEKKGESAKELKMLYDIWLEGDEEKLNEICLAEDEIEGLTEEEEKIIDDFNRLLIDKRNIDMAAKAKEYMRNGKTVFFAVGASHFLGENGIKALLEKDGFKFERIVV